MIAYDYDTEPESLNSFIHQQYGTQSSSTPENETPNLQSNSSSESMATNNDIEARSNGVFTTALCCIKQLLFDGISSRRGPRIFGQVDGNVVIVTDQPCSVQTANTTDIRGNFTQIITKDMDDEQVSNAQRLAHAEFTAPAAPDRSTILPPTTE